MFGRPRRSVGRFRPSSRHGGSCAVIRLGNVRCCSVNPIRHQCAPGIDRCQQGNSLATMLAARASGEHRTGTPTRRSLPTCPAARTALAPNIRNPTSSESGFELLCTRRPRAKISRTREANHEQIRTRRGGGPHGRAGNWWTRLRDSTKPRTSLRSAMTPRSSSTTQRLSSLIGPLMRRSGRPGSQMAGRSLSARLRVERSRCSMRTRVFSPMKCSRQSTHRKAPASSTSEKQSCSRGKLRAG